jgi:hypothetical protein
LGNAETDSFRSDLLAAIRVWGRHPLLPLLSTPIWAFPLPDTPAFAWLALPLAILAAGWVGTERIWYLRAFRGQRIKPSEVWRFIWAFFWRFAKLGLLVSVLLAPILLISYKDPSLFLLLLTILSVPVDIALTFVTPALAYTTNKVFAAVPLGLRMVGTEWPRSAWYVLFPPLVILTLSRLVATTELHGPRGWALGVATSLLYLAFKGATAAFYLRRHEVDENGAAFVARSAESD